MSNTIHSEEDLYNLALSLLGTRRISSKEERSVEAHQCRFFYPVALEEILRTAPWTFATKSADIPQHETAPTHRWGYRYPLPVDHIATIDVNDTCPSKGDPTTYEIADGSILTNATTCWLRYVYFNTNPATFPADFCSALAYLLAAKLAFPITGNPDFGLSLLAIYDNKERPRAARNAANEQRKPVRFTPSQADIIKVRYTG